MTRFHDITNDSKTHYAVDTPGQHVFFLFNRSAELVFDLTTSGVGVFVFGLFIGKDDDDFSISVQQHHNAPRTTSHAHVRGIMNDQSRLRYRGLIRIESNASESDASQTNRNLLLSPKSSAASKPELEILNDDVTCRHAATTGQPNPETLFYLKSRGLSQEDAVQLIAKGFVSELFREMEKFQKNQEFKMENRALIFSKLTS